jgi:alkyl sulfatase BDS1-like metallo-beta-lactamase superfamily hydrolase
MTHRTKSATEATAAANRTATEQYPMVDRQDFDDADRGFIADFTDHRVVDENGKVIMDLGDFDFIHDGPAPDSVNPSLWRQSQVIKKGGLFKVVDGVYQVRSNDIGNLTIVEGDDGLVIIDCTTGVENARQGLAMFREYVSDKPVAGVIYTHTHIDHYGGVKGVVDPADVRSGKVPIIAPGTVASFDKFAIGENVVAGNAMSRRANYAFNHLLDHNEHGMVTCGIAIAGGRGFTVSYLSPTDGITATGERREIAGLTFEFLYAPDTEAPEEMHIWIPELGALTCAENANHGLHNIQTLRGARTRDARNFSRFLDETLERWGDDAEVHYGPHTWPVWGNGEVNEFLESQRDTYKYIHDQSLRHANQGHTPLEAAEEITLPEALDKRWWNHGYHGTLHHDVRAVYTKELGMWDGDPVSLHPHPPVEASKRWVELVGADGLLTEGRRAFEAADYRWAAEVVHKLVFADPDNTDGKELLADVYEQLGYQAEGPQWRGIYLTAALELREGIVHDDFSSASPDTVLAMPIDILFDYAAVHLNGPRAAEAELRIDYEFTDLGETWTMWIQRGVLNARSIASPDTQLTVRGPKAALVAAVLQPASVHALSDAGKVGLDGDPAVLDTYASLLDDFDPAFAIVTP